MNELFQALINLAMCLVGLITYPFLVAVEKLVPAGFPRWYWWAIAFFGIAWFSAGILSIQNAPYQYVYFFAACATTVWMLVAAILVHDKMNKHIREHKDGSNNSPI